MSMALELLIFIGLFALAIGLLGRFIGASDRHKLQLRAAHQSRQLARQPWDVDKNNRRGNR
jgi:hypothetical protein